MPILPYWVETNNIMGEVREGTLCQLQGHRFLRKDLKLCLRKVREGTLCHLGRA